MLQIDTLYADEKGFPSDPPSPKKIPIIGYTGAYIGMIDGKVGRTKVHQGSLSCKEAELTRGNTIEDALYFRTIRPSRSQQGSPTGSPCSTSTNTSIFGSRPTTSRPREKNMFEQKLYEDRQKELSPILGYQGMYLGRIEGKVGKPEIHKAESIGKWESKRPEPAFFTITDTDPLPRNGMYEGCTTVAPESVNNTRLYPITGYTGAYRGKVVGNLGRADRHSAALSSFDGQSVVDILGDGEGKLKYQGDR